MYKIIEIPWNKITSFSNSDARFVWTDVENVAPDGGDCCTNLLDSNGSRLQQQQPHLRDSSENYCTNTTTVTSQQPSSPGKQKTAPVDGGSVAMATATTESPPPSSPTAISPPAVAVLSERPNVMTEQQQLSKTLPRANPTGQDYKRSSRTPRTQSDPSNMPNKADAAITTLQMMMMPPSRHSESVSSLQKRSQSDLSQVGSTESGYSSLSLNAPSPSHSPTRLSSGDFGSSSTLLYQHTITAPVAQTSVVVTATPATVTTSPASTTDDHHLRDECGASPTSWNSSEPSTGHQSRRQVSRSCSTVSSVDANSQTTDHLSSGAGTPLAVRRKSPEEIECEELSRDLISHLSPSDKLHSILGKW